jgi:hypothetical protein
MEATTMNSWTAPRFRIGIAAACVAVAALALPAALAHPRARHHRHHHKAKAVIVVGKPRPVSHTVVVRGRPAGILDLNVKPKDTEVWVDGAFRGTVDSFDGHPNKLRLVAGNHRMKFVTPEGVEVARDIRVQAGVEVNVGLDLR